MNILPKTQLDSLRNAALGKAGAKNKSNAEIDKAAEEFEAMFLSQMLGHMYSEMEVDPVTGGGHAEEVYRSFLNDEYAKLMSRAGGVGIADYVRREMLKLQEVGQ